LTACGHAQANALAADLAKRAPDAVAVCASPLRRAQETAAPVAQALGLNVTTERGLLTWNQPVEADNLPNEEYLSRYAQPGGGIFRSFQTTGESWSDLVLRTGKGLTTIMQAHAGKTVILIGHTESIMASFIALGGLPLMAPFEAKSDPTGMTLWETDGDVMAFPGPRWHLLGFNIVPENAG
jgi:broad specificity phosphatase PhoE